MIQVKLIESKQFWRNSLPDSHPKRVKDFFADEKNKKFDSMHYKLDDAINDFIKDNPNLEITDIKYQMSGVMSENDGYEYYTALIEYEEKLESDAEDEKLNQVGLQILESIRMSIGNLINDELSEEEINELTEIQSFIDKKVEELT